MISDLLLQNFFAALSLQYISVYIYIYIQYSAEVLGHPSICNFYGYISVYYNARMLHNIGKLFTQV